MIRAHAVWQLLGSCSFWLILQKERSSCYERNDDQWCGIKLGIKELSQTEDESRDGWVNGRRGRGEQCSPRGNPLSMTRDDNNDDDRRKTLMNGIIMENGLGSHYKLHKINPYFMIH
ncbi:hypothetical protein NQZ68_038637 [Dissostichus eleginoides]|nr:hypothetical protein NQZ68_038637 [Dissostichus eleginoides]